MYYENNNPVNMVADGVHRGEAVYVKPYITSEVNKLIVHFDQDDGILFSYFFTVGFEPFNNLVKATGAELKQKGEFDENKLLKKVFEYETKITQGKNGGEFCNVLWIKEVTPFDEPVSSKKA